jgi:hypothetical protein
MAPSNIGPTTLNPQGCVVAPKVVLPEQGSANKLRVWFTDQAGNTATKVALYNSSQQLVYATTINHATTTHTPAWVEANITASVSAGTYYVAVVTGYIGNNVGWLQNTAQATLAYRCNNPYSGFPYDPLDLECGGYCGFASENVPVGVHVAP